MIRTLMTCVVLNIAAGPLAAQRPPALPDRPENEAAHKQWRAIPVPEKTPFDGDAKKRSGYLDSYRHGYFWAKYDHLWCPTNPQEHNLHAIRGWVEGWQAGIKAGGTGDLPSQFARFLVWQDSAAKPSNRPDVSASVSEFSGRMISRKDRGGKKVLHGLQVLLGSKGAVKEYAIFNDGVLVERDQLYPSGRTFRFQTREANGDGWETVLTPERSKVVVKSLIASGGIDIGPITEQEQVCHGKVKANKPWSGSFLIWEPIPKGYGERLMFREYRKGELVNSTPYAIEKLALPKDPEHPHSQSGSWPWRWVWDSADWDVPAEWPVRK